MTKKISIVIYSGDGSLKMVKKNLNNVYNGRC